MSHDSTLSEMRTDQYEHGANLETVSYYADLFVSVSTFVLLSIIEISLTSFLGSEYSFMIFNNVCPPQGFCSFI